MKGKDRLSSNTSSGLLALSILPLMKHLNSSGLEKVSWVNSPTEFMFLLTTKIF